MDRRINLFLLFFLVVSSYSVLANTNDTQHDRKTDISEPIKKSPKVSNTRLKPKYQSCSALVADSQKRVFSRFLFDSTEGLKSKKDTECTTNPIFMYAAKYANNSSQSFTNKNLSGDHLATSAIFISPDTKNVGNFNMVDNLDVLSKMINALDDKEYGTYVRQLGLVNNALSCSSASSVRVMDFLLAEILAGSLEGGLENTAEQEKCVQGAFNAALNTFDQLQYTGFSLIQNVLTRNIDKTREILYPDYPVCEAGIWVYDFMTGKLVQLKDKDACNKKLPSKFNLFSLFKRESKKDDPRYRYLLGYLDQFADPRKFGLGSCSQYYVAGSNFTCDVGISCKNPSSNPDLQHTIDHVKKPDKELNDLTASHDFQLGNSALQKPTRFGLAVGEAEKYLCSHDITAKSQGASEQRGAFGQPFMSPPGEADELSGSGKGLESSASRDFFQCQASVLFDTKMNPTASCILSAISSVISEEKRQSLPDSGREPQHPKFVIGGIKDPSCKNTDSPMPYETENWVNIKIELIRKEFNKHYDAEFLLAKSNFLTEISLLSARFINDSTPLIFNVVTNTPVTFTVPDPESNEPIRDEIYAIVKRDPRSPTGYRVNLYIDPRANIPQDRIVSAIQTAYWDVLNKMYNDQEAKKKAEEKQHGHEVRQNDANEDPSIDGESNSACTSALSRALTTLRECNMPDRGSQPRADGQPALGEQPSGVDPLVINPIREGTGVAILNSVVSGLMSCVDQYGADIRARSGTEFGPGGCLPPMTLCDSKECSTYRTNCDSPGQWQCSFALCKEDNNCCGSVNTSRGGSGQTSGDRTDNSINCGDKIWNPAKRACGEPNLCGDGNVLNAGTGRCEPAQPIGPGGNRPGGPELPAGEIPSDLPSCPPDVQPSTNNRCRLPR